MHLELTQLLSGLLVGLIVGFTGVGGGSLMAPIMILFLGVAPVTAVGTDLWFAAITKAVGGAVHHKRGNADLRVVKWLCIGSIPAALVTVLVSVTFTEDKSKGGWSPNCLARVLLLTAIATIFRSRIRQIGRHLRLKRRIRFKELQFPLTMAAGAVLGVLVTLTSVGAGALCATVLRFPISGPAESAPNRGHRHSSRSPAYSRGWPGTPLAWQRRWIAARIAAERFCPGIVIASMATSKLNEQTIQTALSAVLLIVGLRLMLS